MKVVFDDFHSTGLTRLFHPPRTFEKPCTPKKTIYIPLPIWYHLTCPGDVAQLGERDNRTVEVRGSSPLISTMYYTFEEI